MTINDLIAELQKEAENGYGDKIILVEDGEEDFHIDSVQSNRNTGQDPDYLFLMAGEEYEGEKWIKNCNV